MLLMPDSSGRYSYEGQRLTDHQLFQDGFGRIVEAFTTEDGTQYCDVYEWDELNDLDRFYLKKLGCELE